MTAGDSDETRALFRKEIESLLQNSGFNTCNVYGDFNKTNHSKNSPRTIFVATKKQRAQRVKSRLPN